MIINKYKRKVEKNKVVKKEEIGMKVGGKKGDGNNVSEGKRGGKVIGTKKIVDDALKQCKDVTHCLVFQRTKADVPWTQGRDLWWHEELEKYPSYIAPESMNSEDPLFLLYTSGSHRTSIAQACWR